MTARLLIGPAGSGKTRRCLDALRDCERAGEAAFWIVPDQFTYAADRLLLEEGSLAGTRQVRVLSFRRLARLIAAGASPLPDLIQDEGRRLILYPILQSIPSIELGPFAPVRHMPGFVAALAEAVAEAKGIGGDRTSEWLARAGATEPKAAALARIVGEYDAALVRAGLRDPGDWIREVAATLERHRGPWSRARLWIDGFVSFTPEERALLPPLAAAVREITITLCADGDDARALLSRARAADDFGGAPLSALLGPPVRAHSRRPQFLPALRTALWLQQRLPALAVEALAEPPRRFAPGSELARLEADLFAADAAAIPASVPAGSAAGGAPAVHLRVCATPYHEVAAWARLIDARARLGAEWRYRHWAILVRDLDTYRPLVRDLFGRYGIPVYLDERRDAAAHPLVRLHLTLLRLAARGWARELVMELLRNPLLGVPAEAADRIENLSLEYGIDYERWLRTDWQLLVLPPRENIRGGPGEGHDGPGGEGGDEEVAAGAEEEREDEGDRAAAMLKRRRAAADEARAAGRRLFPAARAFTDLWRGREWPFAEAAAALGRSIDALLAPAVAPAETPAEPARPMMAALSPHWTAEESERIAELLRETLAQGARLMDASPVGPGLFARLLREGLAGAAIGVAPQALDAVTLADPRRSRVNEARGVIVGGLAAGSFPREAVEDPILSDGEREAIAGAGFPIGARSALRVEEDPYLFYIACTRAREELFLTRPALDTQGTSQEPSLYLSEVERGLGRALAPGAGGDRAQDGGAGPLDLCRHASEVEPALARALAGLDTRAARRVAEGARAILAGLPDEDAACDRARHYVEYLRSPLPERLGPDLAARLFPKRVLTTSASRLETFASCPFRHFARHILRLEPRPEAVLTPLSTGSAVHEALQRFFADAPRSESADDAAQRMGAIFGDLAREEEFRIFQEDPPSEYRWSVTRRETALFIRTEQRRLSRSLFRPRAVELSFGLAPSGTGGGASSGASSGAGTAAEAERVRRLLLEGPCRPALHLPALVLELPAGPDAAMGRAIAGRILLRGRIDRLDVQSAEIGLPAALVLDYKRRPRGRAPGGELARGMDLQIATYLLAIKSVSGLSPVAGFYYSVGPQTRSAPAGEDEKNPHGFKLQGFRVSAADPAIDPDQVLIGPRMPGGHKSSLSDVLGKVSEQIVSHGARVVSGEIRPAPVETGGRLPCDACDFAGVCRFDPTSMRVPGAPIEDEDGA